MQLVWLPMSLIATKKLRSEAGGMTAMNYRISNLSIDKDRFTMTELAALRNDLLQGGMIDSYEAAELLQVFLMGRGYGVSTKAALDAAGRANQPGFVFFRGIAGS